MDQRVFISINNAPSIIDIAKNIMLIQHGHFSIASPHCRSYLWHLRTRFSEDMPPDPCIVPINDPHNAWNTNIASLDPLDVTISRFEVDKQSSRLDHLIVNSQNWWFSSQPEVSISSNQALDYLQFIPERYMDDYFAFSLRGCSKRCHDIIHEFQIDPSLDLRRTKNRSRLAPVILFHISIICSRQLRTKSLDRLSSPWSQNLALDFIPSFRSHAFE